MASNKRRYIADTAPPGASAGMHRAARKFRGPVEQFLHMKTSGGIVLLVVSAIALIWANSPYGHSYHHLWETPIQIALGSWSTSFSLHFIINDGLMTIFFLVVGLEIKREIIEGELSDLRRAALPIAAALGGMIVPALIYIVLNPQAPASSGWGVPMATDIAFAVGILTLLGNRVPAALRILLLALAIIDDLGAILVIAIFYSSGFNMIGLSIILAGFAILFSWLRFGIRPGPLYLIPLAVLWVGLHEAGIHPTLAGVIVGLATPVKAWLSKQQFIAVAQGALDHFEEASGSHGHDHHSLMDPIRKIALAGREAVSPVVRGVHEMEIWISFGIMPLFALANAGVELGGIDFNADGASMLILGITLGLALGKPFGVMLMSWLCVRLGLASLPKGVTWGGVFLIGLTAGIGFTMAIFIAELAFKGQAELLGLGKLSILIATAVAGIASLVFGRIILKPASPEIANLSPTEVERSTEY